MSESLSVVVMAYNEIGGLESVVREIRAALDALGRASEIVVVDDGSTDGTGALADRLAADVPGVRVVHHRPNQGLGGVYRTGFAEARHDLLTFFPADGQFPADIIPRFAALMPGHDLVLGYLPGGRTGVVGILLSLTERALYHLLFGRIPRFQGIFMVRRAALQRLTLVSSGRGWAIVMEMIVRAARAGFRMRSEPTTLRPRAAGVSKVQNVRTIVSNLRQLVALRRQL